MRVIAENWGVVLMFDSREDLETTIKNLQGELNWADKERLPYPKSYCMFTNEKLNSERVAELVKYLNYRFADKEEK